jgi:hypothetical protein
VVYLDKCKEAAHVRVVLERGVGGHEPGETTASYVPEMRCRNEAGYTGDGILLTPGRRSRGMQLFPDTAAHLAVALPLVAAEARKAGGSAAVAIQHTVGGEFTTWRLFTPDAAEELGALIRTATP